jgi:DNA replication protein DnaC
MQEMVYKIVNARYAQGGPVIVTTNLTQEEMVNPADIEYKRVYSRLLEWCMTVNVEGKDRRMQAGAMNRSIMRKQLGIGGAGA